MSTLVAVLALLSAVAVGARWSLRRHDSLGRPRPLPVVTICLLAIVAGAAGYVSWRHERLEARLSQVASVLVGAEVDVQCQTVGASMVDAGADLGFVKWGPDGVPERRTLIKREVCADLRAYLRSPDAAATEDQVIAVHVLTHEAMHMAGEKTEAVTECMAIQRNAATARLLGASPAAATALAERYWSQLYPRQRDEYRSRECRAAGALDERLDDAPWRGSA
jgi:hypothetical protein